MKSTGFIFYKIFIYGVISLVIFTSSLTLFFQTTYGKNWILSTFNEALQKKGWELSFKSLGGIFPFTWNVTDVELKANNLPILETKTLYFRPYLFRLFRKELAFHTVWIDQAKLYPKNFPKNPSPNSGFDFPVQLTLRSFRATELTFAEYPTISWNLKGKLRVYPFFEFVRANLKVSRSDFPKSKIEANFRSEKFRKARLKAYVDINTLQILYPWVPITEKNLEVDINTTATLQLDGTWEDFSQMGNPSKNSTLKGRLWGTLSDLDFRLKAPIFTFFKGPWTYFSDFTITRGFTLNLPYYSLKNAVLAIEGDANFAPNFSFEETKFHFKTQNLKPYNPFAFTFAGRLQGEAILQQQLEALSLEINLRTEDLRLHEILFSKTKLHTQTIFAKSQDLTDFSLETTLFGNAWSGQGLLDFTRPKDLRFENLYVVSPFAQIEGAFAIQDKKWFMGDLHFSLSDLSSLEPFFPNLSLFGAATGTASASVVEGGQNLAFSLQAFDLFSKPLHAIETNANFSLGNLYETPHIKGQLEMQRVHFMGTELDSLSFSTDTSFAKWPFTLSIQGQNSISFTMEGLWLKGADLFTFELDKFNGYLFNSPFSAKTPITFISEKERLSLSPLQITLPGSELYSSLNLEKKQGDLKIKMKHFPIEFLSFNPFDIGVNGFASLSLEAKKNRRNVSATLTAEIEEMTLLDLGEKEPLTTTGSLQATLEGGFASLSGKLAIREKEHSSFSLSCPLQIEFFPFTWKVPTHNRLFGNFSFEGKAQDILDYVNFGPHRIKGDISCNLSVDGTRQNPHFQGSCSFQEGNYENYYTGASFTDIQAFFEARKGKLYLHKCTGKDLHKGSFSASGFITLDQAQNFPYSFSVDFKELRLVDIDLVRADASGKLYIKGTEQKGKAKGEVNVEKAEFTIPDKLPTFIPSLPITYIQAPKAKPKQKIFYEGKPAYPLELDIQVEAPNTVFIDGRGLTSEWNGNFLIKGAYSDIRPIGSLKLIHGDLVFSGKRFDLQEGLLEFTGKPSDLPYLSISASLQESGITIIASLRGKINAPHLSFKSLPPLPVSSILSYLIFGQDISEISPLQVGQLAATAAMLAGQGPDLLTLTKRSLGIDRLAVVSTPSPEGGETTSLQVGKYLAKGILFSVSQGAVPSTSSVSIEVDLTHGFIFHAESLPQQAQGKFGLKWNYNY